LHFGDGARDSPVSVVEWMDGDEPQVRQPRAQHRILAATGVEPRKERGNLRLHPRRSRSLVVHMLASDGTRHYAHRTRRIVAPDPAPPRRKKRRVPVEESLRGQRLFVIARGIQHHLHHALDVPVGWRQSADVDSQLPLNRRPDLVRIQSFAFDLTRLNDFRSQGLQHCVLLKRKPERFHSPEQPALLVPYGNQRVGQLRGIPPEIRPIGQLMDVFGHIYAFLA
jgi:hypothetical protein